MAKSADAFRTISEVADWLDTPAHVLRFWESKFTQIKPVKRAGGRRYYRPADMALIGGIKKLLHDDGMTIKGAQKVLREQGVRYVSDLSPPLDDDPATHVEPDASAPDPTPTTDHEGAAPADPVVPFRAPPEPGAEPEPEPMAADPADATGQGAPHSAGTESEATDEPKPSEGLPSFLTRPSMSTPAPEPVQDPEPEPESEAETPGPEAAYPGDESDESPAEVAADADATPAPQEDAEPPVAADAEAPAEEVETPQEAAFDEAQQEPEAESAEHLEDPQDPDGTDRVSDVPDPEPEPAEAPAPAAELPAFLRQPLEAAPEEDDPASEEPPADEATVEATEEEAAPKVAPDMPVFSRRELDVAPQTTEAGGGDEVAPTPDAQPDRTEGAEQPLAAQANDEASESDGDQSEPEALLADDDGDGDDGADGDEDHDAPEAEPVADLAPDADTDAEIGDGSDATPMPLGQDIPADPADADVKPGPSVVGAAFAARRIDPEARAHLDRLRAVARRGTGDGRA